MYEAFVLVFSSSFMGLIIGTLLGFIMTLQNALFTDLPIRFIFPYLNFIVILIASILGIIIINIIILSSNIIMLILYY
jgi:hypothetical protein